MATKEANTPMMMDDDDDDDMDSVMYSGSEEGYDVQPSASYECAINNAMTGTRKLIQPVSPKILLPIQGADLAEHIEYLVLNQTTSLPHSSYMQLIDMGRISVAWRRKFTEYIYSFTEDYNLDPLTIPTAINYLDRFLAMDISTPPNVAHSVAGITCVFMASKFVDVNAISLDDLVQLPFVTGPCSAAEFVDAERRIVSSLNWHLNPVTSHRVSNALLSLLELNENIKADATIGECTSC
jgi:hypothetical protein